MGEEGRNKEDRRRRQSWRYRRNGPERQVEGYGRAMNESNAAERKWIVRE